MSREIRLYWWKPTRPFKSLASEVLSNAAAWGILRLQGGGLRNFGDEVGRDVVEAVSGRKVTWAPIERAEVVSVGSILSSVLRRGAAPVVFGSGIREPIDSDSVIRLPEFISVRGALTRDALGLPGEIPIADPGLIASALYARPACAAIARPTFVPHFAMVGTRGGRAAIDRYRSAGWRVELPNVSPREMAEVISSSSLVVTASLHAIVFAHSYGVPVAKLSLGGEAREPEFKYQDYSTALGVSVPEISISSSLARPLTDTLDELSPVTEGIAARVPDLIESVYRAGRALG